MESPRVSTKKPMSAGQLEIAWNAPARTRRLELVGARRDQVERTVLDLLNGAIPATRVGTVLQGADAPEADVRLVREALTYLGFSSRIR